MNNQRMTWAEIKQAYPEQIVGLVDCIPEPIGFKTAVVKYTSRTMPYEEMVERAIDGEISLLHTAMDGNKRLFASAIKNLPSDIGIELNGILYQNQS